MEIKLSMTITIPGNVMMSRKEARKSPNNYDYTNIIVPIYENKKRKVETLKIRTRKCTPATQVINMYKEAYYYMTGNEVPEFSNAKDWKRLNKKQKLEAHLQRICENMNGISYTYTVFPD